PVKAKSKVQSPSAKKQLSFPAAAASPSDSRRHSVPPKIGINSNKNVAATNLPEGKVKGKNGGSR
ncbi:IQ calmodulin-binding motif protein, partial [Trifolium medium]|nr:IQ calmodulin-binding motif protein [Trifolium medium]